ncbi:MAG: tRNA methyl transferase PRC-barrel domain-containing protein, partial [Polyangiaceae bacterium]
VATGHYARLEHRDDGVHLFSGTPEKDQAYALAQLSRAQLDGLLLPLGTFTKQQTRAHAARLGLPVHDKPESQDICFVEGGDYRDVLAQRGYGTGATGEIRDAHGELVGAHAGIGEYTVGQRAGIGGADAARYVTRIDASTNTIVIGREEELLSAGLIADEVNLIRPERFEREAGVLAMIRYRARPVQATASVDANRALHVRFTEPQRAVTPGQLVALFDEGGEEVLGAATIREAA